MAHQGPSFYDNEAVFKHYMGRRKRTNNPNDLIEKPIFLEMLGDVTQKKVLDLGCGDAAFGEQLIAQGAQSYDGIDGSINMIELARQREQKPLLNIHHHDLFTWPYPNHTYDLIISRLALHYIKDFNELAKRIYRTLRVGGRFIFVVQHPVFTSNFESAKLSGRRTDWIVDHYFETGERVEPWLGEEVIKYHRTIEDYFISLQQAGFTVTQLRESKPKQEMFADPAEYQRRKRIPLFLFMAGERHSF